MFGLAAMGGIQLATITILDPTTHIMEIATWTFSPLSLNAQYPLHGRSVLARLVQIRMRAERDFCHGAEMRMERFDSVQGDLPKRPQCRTSKFIHILSPCFLQQFYFLINDRFVHVFALELIPCMSIL
jgi:hypothetical protein